MGVKITPMHWVAIDYHSKDTTSAPCDPSARQSRARKCLPQLRSKDFSLVGPVFMETPMSVLYVYIYIDRSIQVFRYRYRYSRYVMYTLRDSA